MTTSAAHPAGEPGATGGTTGAAGATAGAAKDQARQTAGTAAEEARSVAGTAAEHARSVAGTAAEQARSVADTARGEVSHVAGEAKHQARNLLGELSTQVTDQSRTQLGRLVSLIHEVGDELEEMADSSSRGGVASTLARQAATRTRSVGTSLDGREPSELLDQLRNTARRRPGAFLLGAAAVGLLAGRLTKAGRAAQQPGNGSSTYPAPAGRPVATTYDAGYQPGSGAGYQPPSGYSATGGVPTTSTTAPITPVTGGYAPGGDVLPPTTGGLR